MNGKIVNLKLEKIRRNLRLFEKTGYIDDSLFVETLHLAGGDYARVIYRLKNTLATRKFHNRILSKLDLEQEWELIQKRMSTKNNEFRYPTILCHYRKGMNPVLAMHQEYQRIFLTDAYDDISEWVLGIIIENKQNILDALDEDIERIEHFIEKLEKDRFGAEKEFSPHLFLLLRRLKDARSDFTQAS